MASVSRDHILFRFSCLLLLIGSSHSLRDTLLHGQQLKHGQELVSANGVFRLGFFSSAFTEKSYVGIWYNKSPHEKPVWVANRNTPIFNNSGILALHGNLKILQSGGDPIVLTSVRGARKTSATLLDSGNFVLHEHNLEGSIKQVLWQSFDHPTDTILPGMKLGNDHKTGINRSLTSWRSDRSPASGSFTLCMDLINGTTQFVIWWNGNIHWTTKLPELSLNEDYKFRYISSENETYLSYSLNKDISKIFPMLTLSASGDLLDHDNYSVVSCANIPFYASSGCVQHMLPECRISHNSFVHQMGFMSREGLIFSENDNLSLADCEAKCTSDCSCVAYASKDIDGTGCEYWSSKSSFKESTLDGWRDVYILESKEWTWWRWVMIFIGGTLLKFLLCTPYFIWKRSKAKEKWKAKEKCERKGHHKFSSTSYLPIIGFFR
ncbi:B_lectin domain-containing protein/PAN_2 domain-containing protein [Cephalotus follicularis]|uniref:B_lectin domain-containing protein/PAN_2 domain-containing protein n=1 Tax=Cephalotus follicularis TaxID=3775 RepID=A0A1Q3B9L6_CEPFO|nr:B_lectin domain-containing protein/PAN_2 domain-containing protein [Cephalotus follicularis]